jgi:DNA helicase-2/ATP-dependent DNA helicase PcrA
VLDLTKLNPPQRQAVTLEEGPELVLAGAGSGKTRVIAHRIAWLVEQGAAPEGILALTFTNKAATEMRERVRSLSRSAGAKSLIATFHAFGLWFLKEEHLAADLPRWFSVCDSGDQVNLLKRCLRDVQMDSRRFDVRRLLGVISKKRMAGAERGMARRGRMPGREPGRVPDVDYETIADEILPRYEQALRAQRSLDFDDLAVRPLDMLAVDETLRGSYRERFRHVLVDEFQDTNGVQLRLLELLCSPAPVPRARAGGARSSSRRGAGRSGGATGAGAMEAIDGSSSDWAGRSLCAVGDDDQAIYGWRGADVRNIMQFERYFPGAIVIRLEQNYRSTGRILDCANGVITKSATRRPKKLWTDAPAGDPVRLVAVPDEEEEGRFVAGEIGRGIAGGRSASDFAVLYRLNAQSQAVEGALREVGIPHRVRGGPAFFDRAEVRDVIAWLKICAFPDDDVSLARIVNAPPRGIGDVAMERLGAWAAREGRPAAASLLDAGSVPDIPRGAPEKLAELAGRLDLFRRRFGAGKFVDPARMMFEDLDLRAWLRGTASSPEAGIRKADAVDSVLRTMEWHERRDPTATLRSFLHRLALDSRDEEPEDADGVTLLTLHSAKGLEFPVVFLIGVEEDLLPVSGIQGEASDMEEERRLAYVGITRARETLWITRATARSRRGRIEARTPSRFLEDLPPAAHVRHDPSSAESMDAANARSVEVLKALRAKRTGSS